MGLACGLELQAFGKPYCKLVTQACLALGKGYPLQHYA